MKKRYLLFLSLVLLVFVLPFLPAPSNPEAGWRHFLGRFHILFVHFPAVLILSLVVLESRRLFKPDVAWGGLTSVLWSVTILSCFFTIIAGYLLYSSGDYQGTLVRRHLWGGLWLMLALATGAFLRFFLQKNAQSRFRFFYPLFLFISGGLVIYTSHLGGSLTHGPDFLTEYMPSFRPEKPAAIEAKKPEELLVFQDLIMPAMENRCLSCHNEHKTKGGLLMTSFAALSKGGKSEKPILVSGNPDESELYRRIILPEDDDDHMPPPEKPALSEDEIALIHWWIEQGASPDMALGTGPPGAEGRALMERYLPNLYQAERLKERRQKDIDKLSEELAKLGKKLELIIESDPLSEEGFFAVSMPIPPPVINDQSISKLLPYAEVFSKISLPGAEITDDGLYDLGKMPHLRQLYLPKTCIKGDGLVYLQSLSELQELNLSYSWLTNEGALNLLQLPQLEKVYVFGTEAEPNVLEALEKHLPGTTILQEEGPYY